MRNQFVVAPFSLVVNDFSSIIERVDEKFGVFFPTQLAAGVTNDMVFRNIEERHRSKNQGLVEETRLARPSSSRKRSAEFLRSMTLAKRGSMRDALATYDIFIGDC